MKITMLVEGKTEKAFIPVIRKYLEPRLAGKMPKIDVMPYDGLIPTEDRLRRVVLNLLYKKVKPSDCVIALTDVYTGTLLPVFKDAQDAKNKMKLWVGDEPDFYPHVAQYDFEAWLLPYWGTIQKLAGHNKAAPSGKPETVNHNKPPSYHLKSIFETGNCRDSYVKTRDARRILENNDLSVAIAQCSELKSLINTIITVSEGEPLE
ncbi:MAG: DUF4276 family protein [Spirochaetota bacterium]